jgi:hypothetical protein
MPQKNTEKNEMTTSSDRLTKRTLVDGLDTGPVLITGLPRCGTTTTVATFATHPSLSLYKSGGEMKRLECAELYPEGNPDFAKIAELHRLLPTGRLLVKRPWLHLKHEDALKRFISETNARVIIALRDREGMRQSWSGNGRGYLTDDYRLHLNTLYDDAMHVAFRLEREGLACTTWLPFLPANKHETELLRLAGWAGLGPPAMKFVIAR